MIEGKETGGVNIEAGDDMSKMFDSACQLTYDLLPDGAIARIGEGFRAFRAIDGRYFAPQAANLYFGSGSDGVGTKVEIYERMNNHLGTAHDLGAMVFDDVLKFGGQAYSWTNVLDVNALKNPDGSWVEGVQEGMRGLAQGLLDASRKAGVVAINGEIAELGARINGYGLFNYNWSASASWTVHKERILTPDKLKAGDVIVGLAEPGMRSNGITNLRNVLSHAYGPEWHEQIEPTLDDSRTLGEIVHVPSTIYHGMVTELTGGSNMDIKPKVDMHGFAHVTGGGWRKISSMILGTGLSAVIDTPMQPPAIMSFLQELKGDMSDEDAYGTWHMGQGGMVVVPERDVQTVIDTAAARQINAQPIGHLYNNLKPVVQIISQGKKENGKLLEFDVKE